MEQMWSAPALRICWVQVPSAHPFAQVVSVCSKLHEPPSHVPGDSKVLSVPASMQIGSGGTSQDTPSHASQLGQPGQSMSSWSYSQPPSSVQVPPSWKTR